MASLLRKRSGYLMWASVRSQIEANFIRVPLWYTPTCIYPPEPRLMGAKKAPFLHVPEATLRAKLLRAYPELSPPVVRLHADADQGNPTTVVDRFIKRQYEMIQGGMREADAFAILSAEYDQHLYRRVISRHLASQRALKAGRSGESVTDAALKATQKENVDVEVELQRRKKVAKRDAFLAAVMERRGAGNTSPYSPYEMKHQFGLSVAEQRALAKEMPDVAALLPAVSQVGDFSDLDLDHPALKGVDISDEKAAYAAFTAYINDRVPFPTEDGNIEGVLEDDAVEFKSIEEVDKMFADLAGEGGLPEMDFLMSILNQYNLKIDNAENKRLRAYLSRADAAQTAAFSHMCVQLWKALDGNVTPETDRNDCVDPSIILAAGNAAVDVTRDSASVLSQFLDRLNLDRATKK